ncbi:lipid-transfer protein [Saccharopolyspora shandongensis]|uniref:lipid-transfer protein n=1 Tax=Saccharopolyspora shandongensis TaxID=418495 RepID=UPI0033EDFAB4
MSDSVYVAGVGMIPFAKPGASETYDVMGERAARAALDDAGVGYDLVQQAYAGYVFGDSTSGQAAIYGLGQTSIPVINVNNNCASGSSALWLARQAIASGVADCVLALGFEQMLRGALGGNKLPDRPPAMKRGIDASIGIQGWGDGPMAAQLFGGSGQAYMDKYGVGNDLFAKVAVKSRKHAANNPYAVFRAPITEEEVLASAHQHGPLTKLMCCPPTCGAAAAVLVSEDFARCNGLKTDVRIKAQSMTTDVPDTFDSGDMMKIVGYDMARSAARNVYEESGVDPSDIRVVELHDCFTSNEVTTYEALGLTPEGTAEKFVLDGDNTYGGRVVVNPSGGLMSKGHPLGATGLAQCAELVWQLRGQADARQVDGDPALALQHNLGLGGACVVTLYEKVGRN